MEIEKNISTDGNKLTFVSGGIAGDTIRNVTGAYNAHALTAGVNGGDINVGALKTGSLQYLHVVPSTSTERQSTGIQFEASRVVPVAAQNQPVHFSTRLWRRVS